MNNSISRRKVVGGLAAVSMTQVNAKETIRGRARIVIIGGGFGGASAAMHLRSIAPHLDVTLVEAAKTYTACPFSNLVIAGLRDIQKQAFGYTNLSRAGIKVVNERAINVDTHKKSIGFNDDRTISYDKLILSPGIDFRWNAIEGYDVASANIMPHAWKAGAQTLQLREQLRSMDNGGTVIISIPPAPFRCPPGPYERASLIAHFLKSHKPKSKLLLLDAQDTFSKKPLFEKSWLEYYPGLLERVPGSESGQVIRVDPKTKTVFTDFDTFKADIINIIPPQQAGKIAHLSGVTDDTGWCPIDAITFESRRVPDVHVIGDSTIAAPMPKSAYSANLQGKICAAQLVRQLSGLDPISTTLNNTCYSLSTPDQGFSVSGVYRNNDGIFSPVPGSGGTSPIGQPISSKISERHQAFEWFNTITREAFG